MSYPADWAMIEAFDKAFPEEISRPPDWKIDWVKRSDFAFALARMIEEHYEQPEDPLLSEAREIVAARYDAKGLPRSAERARSGEYDDQGLEIKIALAALKRGIEIGEGRQ